MFVTPTRYARLTNRLISHLSTRRDPVASLALAAMLTLPLTLPLALSLTACGDDDDATDDTTDGTTDDTTDGTTDGDDSDTSGNDDDASDDDDASNDDDAGNDDDAADDDDASDDDDAPDVDVRDVISGTATTINAGDLIIEVPFGALDVETEVRIQSQKTVSAPLPPDNDAVTAQWTFTPHGITFKNPVRVTMPLTKPLVTGKRYTVYVRENEADQTWEEVENVTVSGNSLVFDITAFSIRVGAATIPDDTCTPTCGEGENICGNDGCGGICGVCGTGTVCTENLCIPDGTCTPACGSNVCGNDGCGGSCGTCSAGLACLDGACAEPPASLCGATDGLLAGAIRPMNRYCPQRNNVSAYAGPTGTPTATLFATLSDKGSDAVGVTPAIGPDGAVYAVAGKQLVKFDATGTEVWRKPASPAPTLGRFIEDPLLLADGSVVGCTENAWLVKLDADGATTFETNFIPGGFTPSVELLADGEGNLYTLAGGQLTATDPDGDELWKVTGLGAGTFASLALFDDTLYVTQGEGFPTMKGYDRESGDELFSFNVQAPVAFDDAPGAMRTSIFDDGAFGVTVSMNTFTQYVNFFSATRELTLNVGMRPTPSFANAPEGGTWYAISTSETPVEGGGWLYYATEDNAPSVPNGIGTIRPFGEIVVDNNSNAYISSFDGEIAGYSTDGTEMFKVKPLGATQGFCYDPAITDDGALLVTCEGKLYKLK